MESNSIQYQIEQNCGLIQVGGLLDSKGYGIAFTPGIRGIQFVTGWNSIQYQIERNCDLIQVGGLLDSKGYGIAFTPGIGSFNLLLDGTPSSTG
jgi:hypothetical protein